MKTHHRKHDVSEAKWKDTTSPKQNMQTENIKILYQSTTFYFETDEQ
jgi:hypothetical protein